MSRLVLTKLDFGNAILDAIPSFQLDRLQAVMNVAARLVFQTSRYNHITLLLCYLHWLRAPQRISFRLALWFKSLSVDLNRPTWTTPFTWSPGLPADNACGHRRRRHWMSRLRDCPLSATEHFPSPQHEHGTVCPPK